MYSRSYKEDTDTRPMVPPNYDGTAFSEEKYAKKLDTGPTFEENTAPCLNDSEETVGVGNIGGLFSGGLGGLLGGFGIRMPRIGTEEILIIATALFLLFSKDGDNECAILLLLLLLVN